MNANVNLKTLWPRLQLWLAWLLFLGLLFVAVFGSYFMPHTISEDDKIGFSYTSHTGEQVYALPPIPPNEDFRFGTDHRGYDLLSLILNGAKYTLGFTLGVTLLRFLLAMPLGLLAGVRNGVLQKIVYALQLVFTAVPPLLFTFPLAYGIYHVLGLSQGLPPNDPKNVSFLVIIFVMLVVVGLFPLANQFGERARFFSGKLYIMAARTMGASTGRVVVRHLLPHLRSELALAFITEFVQVLFLVGQLAVFSIFIGGGDPFQVDDYPPTYLNLTNIGEWGGLIAYGVRYIKPYPWVLISVGACFTLTVLALTFFANQLKKRLEQPHLYQTKPLVRFRALAIRKSAVAITALTTAAAVWVVTALPNHAPVFLTKADVAQAKVDTELIVAQKEKQVEQTTEDFLSLLEKGGWEEASKLFEKDHIPLSYKGVPDPYDAWMQGLQSDEFRVSQILEPYLVWRDKKMVVEVQVETKNGETVSWLFDYPMPDPSDPNDPLLYAGHDVSKEDAETKKELVVFSDELMKYVIAGDIKELHRRSNLPGYMVMPKPFGSWRGKLLHGYSYEGIGVVRKLEDGDFSVEVKIKDQGGGLSSWYLKVEPKSKRNPSNIVQAASYTEEFEKE
ncbi:MAG TPA: ABC transporter permease subunit [Bacilli bacterium]|nr:ABC transporter permease subunit [Bacilli bacterium]